MPILEPATIKRAGALPVLPPLSLYVHIPWCVRKCPYCDFNSHELKAAPAGSGASAPVNPDAAAVLDAAVQSGAVGPLDMATEQRYIQAMIADLDQALPHVWGRTVYTVFFGGGTPSLLSARGLDDLLCAIRARLPLAADGEITLEANPGTFEAHKFAQFRALGINRLSIGIQSFNPAHLKALGRIHDAAQAYAAIEIAQAIFDNFNLDLMYALPGQTQAQAMADLDAAISFSPAHISAYHLTIEPNTLFHRHPPQLPDEDASAEMQQGIETRLARAGYEHYETSAFALPGRQAGHNLNYWRFGDYLGIGAGAHGKLSFPDRVLRQVRYKQPREYMDRALAGSPVQQEHVVAVEDLPFEFMMNALRLIDGVELPLFAERTGLSLQALRKALEAAESRGLLERDHLRLRPTLKGQRFLNDLLQIFLR